MKLILIIADAARLPALRRDLAELGAPGYTTLPVLEGAGRTGVHSGDRVHPGALATLWVVAEDTEAERMFDELARRRDAARDSVSRMFLLPVERQA
jgi:nitrogen regulatory protein PII